MAADQNGARDFVRERNVIDLMHVTLHCPSEDSRVPALAFRRPLALAPFLGKTALEHALAGLAADGAKRVRLETDIPTETLRSVVGQGEAWGVEIEVASAPEDFIEGRDSRVFRLDRLPQGPDHFLWRSYRDWHVAHQVLMPILARQRVGMREIAPSVFVHLRSQVFANSRLMGPCWIGANVYVGPGTVVGPNSVIDDGSYIDEGSEVVGSVIGPGTYVGGFTEVRDSFAWGNQLLDLDTGSFTEVVDPFLLGELRDPWDVFRGVRNRIQALRDRFTHRRSASTCRPAEDARSRLTPVLSN